MKGMTNKKLAEKYGVKRKTIVNLLIGVNLPKGRVDKKSFPETSKRMIHKREQDEAITKMRGEGMSPQSIAEVLGLKNRTVQGICQRLGCSAPPGVNHTKVPRTPRNKPDKEYPKPTFTEEELRVMYVKARISNAMATYERYHPKKKVTLPSLSIMENEL